MNKPEGLSVLRMEKSYEPLSKQNTNCYRRRQSSRPFSVSQKFSMNCSNMKLSGVHLNHLPITYGLVSKHIRECTKTILMMVVPEPFTSLYGSHFLRKCFHRGEEAQRSRNLKHCKHLTVFLKVTFPQEFRPATLKTGSTPRVQHTFEKRSPFFVLITFALMLPETFGRQDT